MTTGGADYFYLHDQLGDVSDFTSASGATQYDYTYEPFGAQRTLTQASKKAPANPLRFTGAYLDSTGLYDLRARMYNPDLGQFTRPDPATDSTHDVYGYASQRPTSLTDPTGLAAVTGDGFHDAFVADLINEYGIVHDKVVTDVAFKLVAAYAEAGGVLSAVDFGRDRRGLYDPEKVLPGSISIPGSSSSGSGRPGRPDIVLHYLGVDQIYEVKSDGSAELGREQLAGYVAQRRIQLGCETGARAGGPLDSRVEDGDFIAPNGVMGTYTAPDNGLVLYHVSYDDVKNVVLERLKERDITIQAQVNGDVLEKQQADGTYGIFNRKTMRGVQITSDLEMVDIAATFAWTYVWVPVP